MDDETLDAIDELLGEAAELAESLDPRTGVSSPHELWARRHLIAVLGARIVEARRRCREAIDGPPTRPAFAS